MAARLLLVDDEEDILESLADLLERKLDGIEVLKAPDGPTALEMLDGHDVDLILTDYRMPRMNGLELLEKVAKRKHRPPAILLTAYSEEKAAVAAARRGIVNRFYRKPPDVSQLLEGIRELMDPAHAFEGVR